MPSPYALPDLVATYLATQNLGVPILHVADLAGVVEEAQIAPAVQIIPYRLTITDSTMTSIGVRETLMALAVARFVNQRGGEGARRIASTLLAKMAIALSGWQATNDYSPLEIETPQQPQFSRGFGYYPLQFSTTYAITV